MTAVVDAERLWHNRAATVCKNLPEVARPFLVRCDDVLMPGYHFAHRGHHAPANDNEADA